jgi:FMN phosphatase YigB (HAD superfamily)
MQLEGCFDAIVDIYDIAPYCKPMPEAYQKALALSGENDPQKCVFIDDSPRNLVGARATGMYTIQVGTADKGYAQNNSGAHAHIARLIDLPTVIAPG